MEYEHCEICNGPCIDMLEISEESPKPQTISPTGIESEEKIGDL